jgi:hypothetical protein
VTTGVDAAGIEAKVLSGLKHFQRRTVDHVFRRMYGPDPVTKFLVADEVGLGKTLVARGLIAKAVTHLQATGTRRIDIVYICSNAAIAAQNIRRLNITGDQNFEQPTRITLLPRHLHELDERSLNFVSLTPGTSFNMGSRAGKSEERAVVFRLLEHILAVPLDRTGAYRTLQGGQSLGRFRDAVGGMPRVGAKGADRLDPGLAEAYRRELEKRPELLARFWTLVARLDDKDAHDSWHERQSVVQELRLALARSCVEALEPDLVILDEFQRFRDLLSEPNPDDPDDIRHLTHQLFEQRDAVTNAQTRVLLLSATPYKMYTLRDEEGEDHYADFLRTARFLMGKDETSAFAGELRDYRHALMDMGADGGKAVFQSKTRIEKRLRRFMVRTERLSVTADRSGMLVDVQMAGTNMTAGDIRAFATADRISQRVRAGDVTDFWKSSPYLLNFMTDYKLKRELEAAASDPAVAACIDPTTLLSPEAIAAYERIDPGNARLRALAHETVDSGAWQFPWLPPSLPYYEGRGAWAAAGAQSMTKRLIFSSWNVVPDAISAILSYEAERQMMRSRDASATNDREERAKQRGLLAVRRFEGSPAGMSTFGLLYPCVSLAELGDPLSIARELGAETRSVTADAVVNEAARRIGVALTALTRSAPKEGIEDQRWYWAAPLLLDRRRWANDKTIEWFETRTPTILRRPWAAEGQDADEDDVSAWGEHVDLATRVLRDGLKLGRVPKDLNEALAALAVGGPGVCALRSVARVLGRVEGTRMHLAEIHTREAALRIAWGLRSLFNVPEMMALLRGTAVGDDAYWRRAAEEGVNGNLQATLDEYVHLLPEWLGHMDGKLPLLAQRMADEIHKAVTIRAVTYRADAIAIRDGSLDFGPLPMRVRFALRFGRDGTDDANVLQRSDAVRSAFNSPFWPFVLSSTSVGQEGLDFHQYCHAVVHWNLPANPVDLEQREGRVHRYKGHAVRKNVAARQRQAAFRRNAVDPWAAMFDEAARGVRQSDCRDIEPYWVYDGPAKIERRVPLVPLTREVEHLRRLRASLAVYRLVFGQPRQEDLAVYLSDSIPTEGMDELSARLRIDLSPRG